MELDAYDVAFANAVERSFRDDAIRTAVLIDDQFPNYLNLRNASDEEFSEIARAENIYGFMHNRGLICDIHNSRTPQDVDLHLLDKARKSDLILLDYQLGAAGSKTALKILRHLAVSEHFNLVVLYTAEASPIVTLRVAAAMRGNKPAVEALTPSAEILEQAEDVLADEQFATLDAAGLRTFLTSGKTPWAAALAQALKEAEISMAHVKPLADHIARRWIARLADDYVLESDDELSVECAIDAAQPMWVHCGSCFVAVVQKLPASSTDNEGEYVWGKIGAALRAWRPNIYRLILSEIQNALELEAVAHHEKWLSDELALGLGLYLLESEEIAKGKVTAADVEGSAQSLIDRFVDIIRRRLATHERISLTAISLLGAKLTTPVGAQLAGENARQSRARELAHVPTATAVDWRKTILPTVNAFMVSDAFRGGHVTTGTVLRGEDDQYWLCASPACDLVPRDHEPVLVQLMRLERTNNPPEKYTAGEFVVIGASNDVTMLRAIEAKIRQPALATVVLPAGTRVTRDAEQRPSIAGWFANETGLRAASAAHGFPDAVKEAGHADTAVTTVEPNGEKVAGKKVTSTMFAVVAQLRNSFATRFLMAAGQHQSRVGVDFVDP